MAFILDDIGSFINFLVLGNVQNHRSTTHFTKRIRQMNDANFDLFKTKINCVNWQAGNESDASVLYDCFHTKLACIYEESFPVQEKTYKVFKINTNHGLQLPS